MALERSSESSVKNVSKVFSRCSVYACRQPCKTRVPASCDDSAIGGELDYTKVAPVEITQSPKQGTLPRIRTGQCRLWGSTLQREDALTAGQGRSCRCGQGVAGKLHCQARAPSTQNAAGSAVLAWRLLCIGLNLRYHQLGKARTFRTPAAARGGFSASCHPKGHCTM